MIRRREVITLLGAAAVGSPLAARSQQATRVPRIVFLHGIAENDPEAQARVVVFGKDLKLLDGWRTAMFKSSIGSAVAIWGACRRTRRHW
jgi:hypothetical protein